MYYFLQIISSANTNPALSEQHHSVTWTSHTASQRLYSSVASLLWFQNENPDFQQWYRIQCVYCSKQRHILSLFSKCYSLFIKMVALGAWKADARKYRLRWAQRRMIKKSCLETTSDNADTFVWTLRLHWAIWSHVVIPYSPYTIQVL